MTGAKVTLGTQEVDFGGSPLVLNRDRDTLVVAAQTMSSRAIQVDVLRDRIMMPSLSTRPGADLSLRLFVDGETVTLPGDLLHVFERGTGVDVFVGGRRYVLVVASIDSNLFDFVRLEDTDTGRRIVNRLIGGVGVFGSLVAATQAITAVADQEDPREGRYRVRGPVQGVAVDVVLDLFLARPVVSSEYSAFTSGTWFEGDQLEPILDGTFAADTMTGTFRSVVIETNALGRTDTSAARPFSFRGVRRPDASFTIVLTDILGRTVGTLTANQE